jgi:signal transduction histidine kinase
VIGKGRFFKQCLGNDPERKGTGQGLAIAHIVNKFGGQITFATESGVGTIFTVRMPLGVPDDSAKTNPLY